MSVKGKYKLNFEKIIHEGNSRFSCSFWGDVEGARNLAKLLQILSDEEPHLLLEDLDLALSGMEFDNIYSPNNAQGRDGVVIMPPNAIVNGTATVPIVDLKALLEEWILFIHEK